MLAKELGSDGPAPRLPGQGARRLPVSLLQRRADIQQSEFEVGAATARVGSAVADLFPRVAVTSAVGGQGGVRATTGTPITFIGGIGPSRSTGRCWTSALSTRVSRSPTIGRAKRCCGTRQTCWMPCRKSTRRLRVTMPNKAAWPAFPGPAVPRLDAVKLSSERYERGLTDFLNVLDAERQQFELEAQYVISRRTAGVQLVPSTRRSVADGSVTRPFRRSERRSRRSPPPHGNPVDYVQPPPYPDLLPVQP